MKQKFLACLLSFVMAACLVYVPALAAVTKPSLPTEVTQYVLDNDGLDVGAVYAIYTNVEPVNNNRILHNATGKNTTDKIQGSASGSLLTWDHARFPDETLWKLEGSEGNYTLQNLDSKQYLSLNARTTKNVNVSSTQHYINIEERGNGVYYLKGKSNGLALNYTVTTANGQSTFDFSCSTTPAELRMYKQTTRILPDSDGVAPSGTSKEQPLSLEDTGSKYFRIPSLITLSNGWIVAASDIRWRISEDSPQNLDTIVSISKDGGETWDWEVVNYFDDMANDATGQTSASFIDPSLVQASDGTIHMLVDACPSYVGNWSGNKMGDKSTGFDNGRMIVAWMDNAGQDTPTDVSSYRYYVDINNPEAGQEISVDGESVTLWPICETSTNSKTDYYVDAFLDIYYNYGEGQGVKAVYCEQLNGSVRVHSNLFYRNSNWKAYPVFYIMHRTATVSDSGLEWSAPQFLDIKYDVKEKFIGVCPGRGVVIPWGDGERILFPIYDIATGTEFASVIYSDDGGETWTRGSRANNVRDTGKSSESQIVVLPDGNLRMYSRNTIDYLGYTESKDGGETWRSYKIDNELFSKNSTSKNGCMMSFINLEGILRSPKGQTYDNLILASYPVQQRRTGVVRIGSIDERNNEVTWLNDDTPRFTGGAFAYSCLTQLSEPDTFGLLYEYSNITGTIEYIELTVEDLLGAGWTLEIEAPEITVSSNTLDFGSVYQGYTQPGAQTVTITNTGNMAVTVDLPTSTSYKISAVGGFNGNTATLAPNGAASFTIQPKAGLTVGTYSEALSIVGSDGASTSVNLNFVVRAASSGGGGTTTHYTITAEAGGTTTLYTITAEAGDGGVINPSGRVSVTRGSNYTFTITASDGYEIADVIVDGDSVGAVSRYTFENVRASHTIRVTFTAVEEPPVEDPSNAGVSDWLITDENFAYLTGYPGNRFGPDNNMTRAEAAQMFYDLLRNKNVTIAVNFDDVADDAWYAEAVNTLGSLGIIAGVGDNKFAPERSITRAEFTAIAMRFTNGDMDGENIFPDVNPDAWYYDSVMGAIQYGWISGYPNGNFGPNGTITRAEVTTIVNRMLGRSADTDFANGHVYELNQFSDVPSTHWAYYQIMEATNAHDYTKANGEET